MCMCVCHILNKYNTIQDVVLCRRTQCRHRLNVHQRDRYHDSHVVLNHWVTSQSHLQTFHCNKWVVDVCVSIRHKLPEPFNFDRNIWMCTLFTEKLPNEMEDNASLLKNCHSSESDCRYPVNATPNLSSWQHVFDLSQDYVFVKQEIFHKRWKNVLFSSRALYLSFSQLCQYNIGLLVDIFKA